MEDASIVKKRQSLYLERHDRFASVEERMDAGKALRKQVPRRSQAAWMPRGDRPNPVALLDGQNATRLPELVPLRWGRMLESPFAFMRGSAIVMATDLATTPNSGIRVQACGDCHLLNFGAYATPERNLIFDINDFDETLPAPWEWDVKRLAASLELAGRYRGFSSNQRAQLVRGMVRTYREFTQTFARKNALEIWYARLDLKTAMRLFGGTAKASKQMREAATQARRRTLEGAFIKMTEIVDGRRRIIDDPPVITHLKERRGHIFLHEAFERYLTTVRDDLRLLINRFRVVDMALKVVGVGSVGTRCGILLMMANDGDPLILQVKEANRSVLDTYAGRSDYANHGQRVVVGQRVMQASSDTFLGWTSLRGRHYYLRQLRDMKWALDVSSASGARLERYSRVCGATLARAHARSTDAAVLAGYLGNGDTFDEAMVEFAAAYADQAERDYAQLKAAAKSKRIKVARG